MELGGAKAKSARGVLDNPLSAKALGKAAGRTAVAVGLSHFASPFAASRIAGILRRVGHKRAALLIGGVLGVMLGASFLVFALIIALVAAVLSVPGQIVDSIVEFFFGDDQKTAIECVAVEPLPARPGGYPLGYRHPATPTAGDFAPTAPTPPASGSPITSVPVIDGKPGAPPPGGVPIAEGAVTWPTPASGRAPAPIPPTGGDAPMTSGTTGHTPPASIGLNGKPTEKTRELLWGIPEGADARQAESWLLYALTHPSSDPLTEWNAFAARFAEELSAVGDGSGEDRAHTGETANSLDIVRRIDVTPYYEAHTLAAAVGIANLNRVGRLALTNEQRENLHSRVLSGCGLAEAPN